MNSSEQQNPQPELNPKEKQEQLIQKIAEKLTSEVAKMLDGTETTIEELANLVIPKLPDRNKANLIILNILSEKFNFKIDAPSRKFSVNSLKKALINPETAIHPDRHNDVQGQILRLLGNSNTPLSYEYLDSLVGRTSGGISPISKTSTLSHLQALEHAGKVQKMKSKDPNDKKTYYTLK